MEKDETGHTLFCFWKHFDSIIGWYLGISFMENLPSWKKISAGVSKGSLKKPFSIKIKCVQALKKRS